MASPWRLRGGHGAQGSSVAVALDLQLRRVVAHVDAPVPIPTAFLPKKTSKPNGGKTYLTI